MLKTKSFRIYFFWHTISHMDPSEPCRDHDFSDVYLKKISSPLLQIIHKSL